MDKKSLSRLATTLITAFEREETPMLDEKISVNPLVSKFATWYEKLRNAMDYREEEVILRAAIERILKRRMFLGGDGKTIAEPLIRELVWARYFPDESLSESIIGKVQKSIDLHLQLKTHIVRKHKFGESEMHEWMYHLLSSDIEHIFGRNKEKELMNNFMFQVMKRYVKISHDSEQNKDVQVFIAIRRSFAKDDLAFLRYHLFVQYFGRLAEETIEEASSEFLTAYKEIQDQFRYPRKDAIFRYIKNKTAIFLILEDVFKLYKGRIRQLCASEEELDRAVLAACEGRYRGISSKIQRAIIRSVIFILLTKAFFALTVESTVENILYGEIIWKSILINTSVPALLMVFVGFLIRTPGRDNSLRILSYIKSILLDENPALGVGLTTDKNPPKRSPILNAIFTILWFLAFFISFGFVVYVLNLLKFTPISQGVFLFFLAIVSFLGYRIGLTSREYAVEEKQGLLTPVIDFLFMPIVRVGRHLTEGISQINILLFVFDFIIETPFKSLFGFFEQWFFFLHAKREGLE